MAAVSPEKRSLYRAVPADLSRIAVDHRHLVGAFASYHATTRGGMRRCVPTRRALVAIDPGDHAFARSRIPLFSRFSPVIVVDKHMASREPLANTA